MSHIMLNDFPLYDDDTDFDTTDFNPSPSSHEPWQRNIEISHAQNNILSSDCDDDSADLKPSVSGLDSNSEEFSHAKNNILSCDYDDDSADLKPFVSRPQISGLDSNSEELELDFDGDTDELKFFPDLSSISITRNDHQPLTSSSVYDIQQNWFTTACAGITKLLRYHNYISMKESDRIFELISSNSEDACEIVANVLCEKCFIPKEFLEENPQEIILNYWLDLNSPN